MQDNEGWIKMHRQFDDWEWRHKPEMVSLFLHMLIQANYEDSKFEGTLIKRGQCIFGRVKWAEKLGISEQSLRTCLERLKSTNEITTEITNKFTIITIVKYEEYQQKEEKSTSTITSKSTTDQPATNQQSTTSKEEKEIKNIRKVTKSANQQNELFENSEPIIFPDWLPIPEWEQFMLVRVKLKAVQSEHALKLLLKTLTQLKEKGYNPVDIINDSIKNSWKDFYEPKCNRTDRHNNFAAQNYDEGVAESGFRTPGIDPKHKTP